MGAIFFMDREVVRQAFNRFIRKNEKSTFAELADLFNISKPTLTETIDRFLKAGLVKKTRCENDQRVYYISLTKKGETLAMTNELESKKAVSKIFERLTEEEIELAVDLFNKMGDDIK